MSFGARGEARRRYLRRGILIAAVLGFLALILLAGGHWIIGIVVAAAAAVAIWLLLQLRSVR